MNHINNKNQERRSFLVRSKWLVKYGDDPVDYDHVYPLGLSPKLEQPRHSVCEVAMRLVTSWRAKKRCRITDGTT